MEPLKTLNRLAQPPWTGLGARLESLCRKALLEFSLLENAPKISVALSGGKDSLTLLYLLKAISGRGVPPFKLVAIHVAGNFSCGASLGEKFLKPLCDQIDVPLIICQSKETAEEDLQCYSCSRERRRLIFEAAKAADAPVIAFGHHRDDAVETMLMNLLHKAEFAGNLPKVPMHAYGVTLIRPLLFVTEEEIRSFAQMYGFHRIVCQCPVGQRSLRRKTKELLSDIQSIYPNARTNLFQAMLAFGSTKATQN